MKRIEIIQALRGVAALLVVMYHSHHPLDFPSFALGNILFGPGAIGVDIFFIISGFIMVYTTQQQSGLTAAARFFINRIIRIVPLYYLATLAFVIIAHGFYWLISYQNLWGLFKTFLFLPKDPNASGPFYGWAYLITGWTLNYEILFYVIFGVAIVFGRWRWTFFFTAFGILLLLVPLATGNFRLDSYTLANYHIPYFNFATNPLIAEFLVGVALGFLFKKQVTIPKTALYALTVLVIAFLGYQYFSQKWFGNGPFRWGLSCVPLMFVIIMWIRPLSNAKIPSAFTFLGDISYSVYLIHPIILKIFEKTPWLSAERLGVFELVPYLALVILLSWITNRLIERRLSNFLKDKLLNLSFLKKRAPVTATT